MPKLSLRTIFCLGQRITSASPTPGTFDDVDLLLRKQWKISQRLADLFWKRWVKEFLPTLVKRSKWHATSEPVKVGDLVIIVEDGTPRDAWIRGIITKVNPGRDGVIRDVEVKTNRGIYRRPVVKVIVLDVNEVSATQDQKPGGTVVEPINA